MKRAHGGDESSGRDRTPDMKRQRHFDDQQRYPHQSQYQHQGHQQQRTDSYSRRDERYLPPRGPDSFRDNTRRGERDTPTPHERRATPVYERGERPNDSNGYVRPIAAYVGSSSSANASTSASTTSSSTGVRLLSETKEEDPHRLAQRQKQIDYGKNTVGYDLYCSAVPKHQRRKMVHPMTPDKTLNVSKKAFDGMIRKWRQALHKYDPPELQDVKEEARPVKETPSSTDMEVSSQSTAASDTAASHTETTAAAFSASHDDDMADLDPERYTSTTSSTTAASAPALSIYENFVEGDMDDDDDDDLL